MDAPNLETADSVKSGDGRHVATLLDPEPALAAMQVDRWVGRRLETLRDEAETLVEHYQAEALRLRRMAAKRAEGGKAFIVWKNLGVRVKRQKADPDKGARGQTFSIEWLVRTYHPARKKPSQVRLYRKPKGDGYNIAVLKKGTINDESPLIEATEGAFAIIRQEVRMLNRLRESLRRYAIAADDCQLKRRNLAIQNSKPGRDGLDPATDRSA